MFCTLQKTWVSPCSNNIKEDEGSICVYIYCSDSSFGCNWHGRTTYTPEGPNIQDSTGPIRRTSPLIKLARSNKDRLHQLGKKISNPTTI